MEIKMIKQSILSIVTVTLLTVGSSAINLKVCIGCHGTNFDKPAMGISRIVKDLKESEIVIALLGYKSGVQGGSMKEVMKSQVSKFNERQLHEIASVIKSGKMDINSTQSNKRQEEVIEVQTDKCIGCHGERFQKPAMGYSRIVNQMSKEDIIASMNGYKYGTYGGEMKALMAGQATKLSTQEIEAFAQLIGKK
jgi:cytochrome c-type protein NapB